MPAGRPGLPAVAPFGHSEKIKSNNSGIPDPQGLTDFFPVSSSKTLATEIHQKTDSTPSISVWPR